MSVDGDGKELRELNQCLRVKSYCRLNLLRASTFNFERLDILRDSIRHPSKKLLSFELAGSINIQFRASRYVTGLNPTSE